MKSSLLLLLTILVEKGCGKSSGLWAGMAERQRKQRTMESGKTKEEMDRTKELQLFRF